MEKKEEMTFFYELIQAKTMIPVFLVHFTQQYHTRHQSWVGMIHSVISYMMHFSFWWFEEENVWLGYTTYVADKCFILAMMWGFHYHFEPVSAKIVVLPVILDMGHIIVYQHDYFLKTRFAYFDIFLLVYITLVSLLIIYLMKKKHKMATGTLLFLCMIGYSMEIHGLMHLLLAPGFWLFYEEIKTKQEKKLIISTNNKKEHEL